MGTSPREPKPGYIPRDLNSDRQQNDVGLERPAIGDAASRGQGTHLAASLPVHRLAMHAPQPHSLTAVSRRSVRHI